MSDHSLTPERFLSNLSPENTFLEKNVVHLHIPEGAVPKDGPSVIEGLMSLNVTCLSGRHYHGHRAALVGDEQED
eukprot:748880-Hanusia_phi.AAC.6